VIGPGEIHVWTIELGDAHGDRTSAAGDIPDGDLLDEAERAARDRLRLAPHRADYERRHGALRRVLSWCDPTIAPAQWRFTRGGRGRPEIAVPRSARRLRFNLSHTTGWAAIAVTCDQPCGVDIEDDRRPLNPDHIARMALSDRERQELQGLSPQRRHHEVLRRWTTKEAYLKGTGVGLDVCLRSITTTMCADGPRVEAGPHATDARGWQLRQWTDEDHLLVTVAYCTPPGSTLALVRHRGQPTGSSPTTDPTPTPAQEGLRPCTT
jgi:4'-phosphopantetheinyl transferase